MAKSAPSVPELCLKGELANSDQHAFASLAEAAVGPYTRSMVALLKKNFNSEIHALTTPVGMRSSIPALHAWLFCLALCGSFCKYAVADPGAKAAQASKEEFFESRIRPLLVARCYSCHGTQAKPKGELRLTSRHAILAGGKRGPALNRDKPESSLLLRALRHDSEIDLKMPPKGKLTDQELADVTRWIGSGAAWPNENRETASDVLPPTWAFEPLRRVAVPNLVSTSDLKPLDAFLRQKLTNERLSFARPADRATLLRRLSFDLTGLPPTPDEIQAFAGDSRIDAIEREVDRLLASPRYGERWARHWLDVIGYAETDGHEYDPNKPNAFRYRDYVIEAFNRDLPYDQFVREHIAGDLLPEPRMDSDGRTLLSPLATAFYWFGEVQAVPVDRPMSLAIETERQVDVIGKAFLGLTIACARCHDHKFDPIPTADYYSLAGYLQSSKKIQSCIDSPEQSERIREAQRTAAKLEAQIESLLGAAKLRSRRSSVTGLKEALLSSREIDAAKKEADSWPSYLAGLQSTKDPIFYPWFRLTDENRPPEQFVRNARSLGQQLASVSTSVNAELGSILFEDFEKPTFAGWEGIGYAFALGPDRPGPAVQDGYVGAGFASSYGGSDRLVGRLISPEFLIERGYIGFWIAGGKEIGKTCLEVTEEGQALPKLTATGEGSDQFVWKVLDARTLVGRKARIELVDESESPGGHVLVDHIVFSDIEPLPDQPPNPAVFAMLQGRSIATPQELAASYQDLFQTGLEGNGETPGMRELQRWALAGNNPWRSIDLSKFLSKEEEQTLAALQGEFELLEKNFPSSALGLVTAEGTPHDVRIQMAGNPQDLGAVAPRGFLGALSKEQKSPEIQGSGRLQLADWMLSAGKPLLARVLVNRVWQYHFGRGIVATPDNFGALGARPSHPELLDYLANRLIESGWSLKALHREMILSQAYQQSSATSAEARERDPENLWLSHMPVRRLDAECVRDTMLAIAGNLDDRLYGPSVPLHVTPFMEGRDVPPISGPADGARRRSIYLEVRRNHQGSLLSAFDFPKGVTSVGRRQVSTVPSQALTLLNEDFPRAEAEVWANRILEENAPDEANLRSMYTSALGHEPSEASMRLGHQFLAEQFIRYEGQGRSRLESRRAAYADFAHVIFNLAEFIHVY